MVYGIWSSAGGMAVNQYRLDVSANNLANIDTVGFKHDIALLTERPVESQEEPANTRHRNVFYDRLSGGTLVAPTVHTFGQGPTMVTNDPLDAMIDGKGFFAVQTPDGVQYTRDGRFTVNSSGTLVTVAGSFPVLSEEGQPIKISEGPQPYVIEGGHIMQADATVDRLALVEFDDLHLLRKVQQNRFAAAENQSARPATDSNVMPGRLEGSTVDPVNGIARMIEISRSFEMNASILRMQDQTLGRAVNDIARA